MSLAALDGVRVLDLTSSTFNYAGKLLAGFGADVVKVEPPSGDDIRHQPPFVNDEPHPELSGRHLHMNTGKRSVVIDLDTEAGADQLRGLLDDYDILIESYRPGYLAERDLGYEQLAAIRPDLIMASVTHFGQDGPYADYAATEIVTEALSGYLYLTGDPDREPVKCFDNLVEHQAALQAAVAVMVALTYRDATGEGDHLDIAAIEAGMLLIGGPAQVYHLQGERPVRVGTRLLVSSPDYPYPSCIRPCKDGYVHAHSNNRYAELMGVLMESDRLLEPEMLEAAYGHADEIDEIMDAWLSQYDKFEVVRRAQELRLPFTEVLTPAEILEDPHLAERGFFSEVEHPLAGRVKQPGAPSMMTGTPWVTGRAPLLGEHTEEILGAATDPGPHE